MTSINTSTSAAQYYQLASQNSSNSQTNTSSSNPSLADILSGTSSGVGSSLADVLNADSSSSSNSNSNSAYTLDLSPEAQQILNSSSSSSSASLATSSAITTSGLDTFTLTTAQQKSLDAIIQKYSSLPQTQANFDAMQNDLKAAGLSTDELKAQDQAKNFNADQLLISELNGTANDVNTATNTASDEDTKANNFMQSVITSWSNALAQNGGSSNSDTTTTAGA